jgi:hypothetical protein
MLFLLLGSGTVFAELSDEDYTARYFGTRALLHTQEQIYNPEEMGWWTDRLPEQLTYDTAYLAGLVNAGRLASGDQHLLDPSEYVVMPGSENFLGSYYEYDISFLDIRPSEVEMIFESLGGLEQILPGATLEFAPLKMRDYYYYSQDPGNNVIIKVGSESLDVSIDMSAHEIHDELVRMFRATYDRELNIDLYYSQQISSYRQGVDISITVTLLDKDEAAATDDQ